MPADVIIDPTNGQIYWNDGTGTPQSISIKGDALNAISFVGYSGSFSPGSTPSGQQTLVTVNDNSGTDALVPGTSGFNLGSSTLRWNTFATNANLSGTLIVSDATNSSSLLTGSVRFNGGIAISGGASIGQTLYLYGVGTASTSYTGLKAGSTTTNTLYTLPITYPSTGSSVLQSDSTGLMSWVPMTATSASSGGTVSSGTQYQIAGYYSGTGASVSGSSTFLNNTAIGQIQIAHTTASFGTSSGALQVAGGVGISGKLSFNQASFGTTGIASNPTMAMIGQTGDPIYMSVLEDNSITFEGSQGQLFAISPNLTTGYIWAVNDISGVPLLRSNVNGNSYIAEFGGYLGIGQTNPAYKLDVKGNIGLASLNDNSYSFIFNNISATGSNSLQIRSANSLRFYSSDNQFYTAFKSRASADKTYLLPATDGSSGQFLQTDGSQNLSWATASGGSGSGSTGVNPGGQYEVAIYAATGASVSGSSTLKNDTSAAVVSISHSTISTNYGSGALTVSGGVGIGGSLYVGGTGSSISGVRFASGVINLGTWNGTVISTTYGGTGLNLTGTSGVLTVSSGTVSASTTSSAISSAISDKTGSGALTFATSPDFTTSVTTGSGTFAVFNTNATTINAFGAATTLSLGAATGTATFNSTNNSTATNNGSVVFSGGVGIGKSVSVGGRLLLFNGSTYTGFASSQVGTGSTIYFLPPSSPATGTSVLQSDSTGVMSWVPMVATSSGAGSGTVAIPDAQYRVAYYAGTGASVSSTSLITAAATGVSVGGSINSTSTTTGSLIVWGGLGITGNAFIGGTAYIPSTTPSNISNLLISNNTATTTTSSGALVVTGGAAVGQTLSIGGSLNIFSGASLYTGFKSAQSGVNTTYTLPPTTPSGTATSYLSSSIDGVMAWVAAPISGGSGSVNSGAATYAAYYATTTNAVSQNANLQFTGSGVSVGGNINSTSTTTGSLLVWGGLGITGNAFIGGTAYIPSTTPSNISNLLVSSSTVSTSTSTGALVIAGGVGIGGSLYTATGSSSSVSGVVLANGNVSATTYNKLTLTAPNNNATLTLADGSTLSTSGSFGLILTTTAASNVTFPTAGTLLTSGATSPSFLTSITTNSSSFDVFNTTATTINAFGNAGTISIGAATGKATFNSTDNSTATNTGSLVVSGGAGFAKSVSIGGRLQIFNSSLYTAFVGAQSGVNTTYTLPPTTPSGTATSYLSSSVDGVMAWVAAPISGGSGSVNSGTATYAAYYATTTNAVSQNANLQFTGTGLSVGGNINSTSTTTGSIYVWGGLGITGNAFIGGTAYIPSTTPSNISNLLISNSTATTTTSSGALVVTGGAAVGQTLSIGGSLNIFNSSNYSGFKFAGTANTTYTLPPRTPTGTGSSYLSSSIDGIMAWVAAPTGGSGSPGGSNKQIQYNSSSSFAGASGFEYTNTGIAVTVSIFSPSGTGYTSGLWVNAIDGVTTRVGIGLSNPAYELEILGEISATNKSFVIDHPTKNGMKLRYGSLEGPENGVYVRGELKNYNIIEVPDHWLGLVHPDSYTVHLTPIGKFAQLYVEKIENYNVFIADTNMNPIHCYYSVWAERKDIPKLITEYEAQ